MPARQFTLTCSILFTAVGLLTDQCWAAPNLRNMPYGVATVARFKKPPTVDGRLEPGEWGGALRTTGFQAIFGSTTLDARAGAAYFGFSRDRLSRPTACGTWWNTGSTSMTARKTVSA